MKIPNTIYDNLTPRQRVAATIKAEAREDEQEVQRLVKSCPRKTYSMTDADYTDTMQEIHGLALAAECDMRGVVISFLIAKAGKPENAMGWLQQLSNLQAVWQKTLAEHDLEEEDMQKAAIPHHPLISTLLDLAPPPDEEAVAQMLERMEKHQRREI